MAITSALRAAASRAMLRISEADKKKRLRPLRMQLDIHPPWVCLRCRPCRYEVLTRRSAKRKVVGWPSLLALLDTGFAIVIIGTRS